MKGVPRRKVHARARQPLGTAKNHFRAIADGGGAPIPVFQGTIKDAPALDGTGGGVVGFCMARCVPYRWALFFSLQMPCVIVPMGQKAHHVRGLKKTMTIRPRSREVSIRL